jgi:hypothetical protein
LKSGDAALDKKRLPAIVGGGSHEKIATSLPNKRGKIGHAAEVFRVPVVTDAWVLYGELSTVARAAGSVEALSETMISMFR